MLPRYHLCFALALQVHDLTCATLLQITAVGPAEHSDSRATSAVKIQRTSQLLVPLSGWVSPLTIPVQHL